MTFQTLEYCCARVRVRRVRPESRCPVRSSACTTRRWLWPPSRVVQFARIVILHREFDALRHQPFYGAWRVGNEDGGSNSQLGTGDEGVADVVFKIVVRVHHGGNPALRQIG